MAYTSNEQEHEKRKNQEGSYSVYNHMYHYLEDNFEPKNLESSYMCEKAERMLIGEGMEYCLQGGKKVSKDELKGAARNAICNFVNNEGKVGNDPGNLGRRQENSLNNIKQSLADLRW